MRLFYHQFRWGWIETHLKVEPRDLWIGLYWKRYPQALDLYICLLPVLPIRVYVQWY